MLVINLQNVEDLIFLDKKVHGLLPDMRHLLEQWMLGKRVPFLRSQRRQAALDMLNGLKEHHVKALEAHFKTTILVDTLYYHVTKTVACDLSEEMACEFGDARNFGGMAASRDAGRLYISFWR